VEYDSIKEYKIVQNNRKDIKDKALAVLSLSPNTLSQ